MGNDVEYLMMINGEPIYDAGQRAFGNLHAVRRMARRQFGLMHKEGLEVARVLPLEHLAEEEYMLLRGYVVDLLGKDGGYVNVLFFTQDYNDAVKKCEEFPELNLQTRKLVALNPFGIDACVLRNLRNQTATLNPSP